MCTCARACAPLCHPLAVVGGRLERPDDRPGRGSTGPYLFVQNTKPFGTETPVGWGVSWSVSPFRNGGVSEASEVERNAVHSGVDPHLSSPPLSSSTAASQRK